MSGISHAVFLSYASQDAEGAQRICAALRAAGVEVWFDQSELRGGDAWDQSIRKQIKTCALFVPIISKHTHERAEGYFRLEWKLAVDRSHLITSHKAFLLPLLIDETSEEEEHVPDKFREVQWTRLPGGETPPAFVERIKQLLSPELSPLSAVSSATATIREPVRASRRAKSVLLAIVAVIVFAALAYFVANRFWMPRHAGRSPPVAAAAPETTPRASAAPAAFNPPPHSIAVLPFVNMSGDKEQEYFSDGLSEELLNSLARINELQVAARTSSFYFKGEHADLATIARKLNVASVLEGSVRRSGNTIRVTAQLNNAVTGFHLWSQTYDRTLSDVLKLQTEIANAVANALKITLLGDLAARIEIGGTRNPAAFDAYLRASKAYWASQTEQDLQAAITAYSEAIRLDPDYAVAYADRAIALTDFAEMGTKPARLPEYFSRALADARRATALAPELGEGHLALAALALESLEFTGASQEYERALALAPGNARVLSDYGWFAVAMGRTEAGLAAARHSVILDPLNEGIHVNLGETLRQARRYSEAVMAFTDAKALDPNDVRVNSSLGLAYYSDGNFESARAAGESHGADEFNNHFCLALVYEKLGRHADAETALAKLRTFWGDAGAVQYAGVYAQWGQTARALDWLETAMRHHDPLLKYVKTDEFIDPLRKEPRFQSVERELKFPPQ